MKKKIYSVTRFVGTYTRCIRLLYYYIVSYAGAGGPRNK
jgi:hypothetical protein